MTTNIALSNLNENIAENAENNARSRSSPDLSTQSSDEKNDKDVEKSAIELPGEENGEEKIRIVGLGKALKNPRYNFLWREEKEGESNAADSNQALSGGNSYRGGRKTLGQFFFSGRITRHLLWPFALLVSFAYLVIIFGLFPLGKPLPDRKDRTTLDHTWVLLALVNPINSCVIGYLHYVVFLCCMGVERPFQVHPAILAILFVIQIVVWGPTIPNTGFFDFFGLAAIGLSLITAYLCMFAYERLSIKFRKGIDETEKTQQVACLKKNYFIYLKIGFTVLVFLFILVTFIFAFEYLGNSEVTQKIIPFAMSIIVFIIRKTMLGLMDAFPHEIAMFVSGFWIENMYDMFQSIAYPSVKDPTTYIAVWVANLLSVVANLVFLTMPWFKFRIWIKAVLIGLFTCKPVCHPGVEPEMEEIEDERGHGNNLIGYHKRQIRFYFLKVLSKMVGCIFYLSTSAILRYGPNSSIYPFAPLTERQYQYSLAFSAGNFVFFFLAGVIGYFFLKKLHRDLLGKMKGIVSLVVRDRAYVGLVVTVLVHNGILALYMLMYFNRIWYSFNLHRTVGIGSN